MISIKLDVNNVLRMGDRLRSDQIPFATSVALNEVAKAAQAAQRIGMADRFMLRRAQWARMSVKIAQFSNKRRLEVLMGILPPGGQKNDVFGKFEDGGKKTSHDGGRLAIPVDARRGRTGVVGNAQRPKAFDFQLHGKGSKATVYIGDNRTFLIKNNDGRTGGIYQRMGARSTIVQGRDERNRFSGRVSGRAGAGKIKTLYRFTKEAHIDSRLKFEETVEGTVRASFATTFRQAFDRAIAAGRTQTVGTHGGAPIVTASKGARRTGRSDVGG